MINNKEKGQLRKLTLLKRDALSPLQRSNASALAAARLLSLPQLEEAQTVMCYVSFRSELDTGYIIETLTQRGKTLCFPVCEKNGIMRAWQPEGEDAWRRGMMGIREPDIQHSRLISPDDIQLVICPMVGFDRQLRRMGYGGGYYDRFLPHCTNALRVGIAFEAQCCEEIFTDGFDQAMDIIVTEKQIYKK